MKEKINIYSIDELNNMNLKDLNDLENLLWNYRKKVNLIIDLQNEINKEE